jgi:hypothetical protein
MITMAGTEACPTSRFFQQWFLNLLPSARWKRQSLIDSHRQSRWFSKSNQNQRTSALIFLTLSRANNQEGKGRGELGNISRSFDTNQTLVLDIGCYLKKGLNGLISSLSAFDKGNVGSRNSQSMMVCLFLGKQEIVYSSFS